ncbi:SulP family inorganic anion transporter [Flammeovirgaceae bacterium SG7u.111]|nr:SulP family inorganic anion transporter [Flammeovirgaceae bacterium SG7u.132]WPO33781.1 SulP family inorganic anion transporter [Flammeovirgaceae bacterium SG7u.111]
MKKEYFENLKYDIPAGLVVFLVAVPLCLGIALASGTPFTSGIIAGMIGGLVIPLISRSQMSVAGPAAGLTAVVLAGVEKLGSFEVFLVAVVIAGILQIILGLLKAGFFAYFFPSSVIRGMLSAIGLILILKQLPHAIGYDVEIFGKDSFQATSDENTLTLLLESLVHVEWGAFIISFISLGILILWEKVTFLKNMRWLPGALVVVVLGIIFNEFFGLVAPQLKLAPSHLVSLPVSDSLGEMVSGFNTPDWSAIMNKDVWILAVTIGLIASVETLLTIEAVDKIDPYKRKSPLNRELLAQGVGNTISGLIGGIPLTSVIVRSSAGINSGGRTKMTAFSHGVFMLISVVFFAKYLNLVPLASLAAILLQVGYKLAKPSVFKVIYKKGWEQFAPFLITVVAILLTDLLIGITIGIVVGLVFVIRTNFHSPMAIIKEKNLVLIKLMRDVSFLNKAVINETLENIESGSNVIIDGTNAMFIDNDVIELLQEFVDQADQKNLKIELKNLHSTKFSNQPLELTHSNTKD